MTTQFTFRLDHDPVTIRLYALSEYEAAGGVYSDAGNGGDDLIAEAAIAAGIPVRGSAAGDYGLALEPVYEADRERLAQLKLAVRREFVAAAEVQPHDTDLADNDVLEAAGLGREDYWYDSAVNLFLLRRFPDEAPLAARLVESASTA